MPNIYGLLYSARSAYRRLRSGISLLRLKTGAYRKADLPEYDFSALTSKWPYRESNCVSDNFTNTPYDGKTNLSVIVPLYNSSAFVERLAGQLMNQKTKYNYEVIFVDDGSTDDTADKVRKLSVRGGGITFISQENKGIGGARNTGIENACGEYIAFEDHDDEVTELFVEKILEAAYINDADVIDCCYELKYHGHHVKTEPSLGYVHGGAFKRNLFKKVRFPSNHYWYEDMINSFIIRPQAHKSVIIQDVLYIKNRHSNNATQKVFSSSNYKCLEQIYLAKSLVEDYRKLGINDENYLFVRTLNELSFWTMDRTSGLDENTRKQVFLACHEIMSSFKHKPSGLSRKQQIFYDAIMSKDFTAWNLAAKL